MDHAIDIDQASGLRRMFGPPRTQWTLILQPTSRSGHAAAAIAAYADALARSSGPTLVVDAARTQLAVEFGLHLRYDLEHALNGDCALADACVAARDGLWILPAARALDAAFGNERRAGDLARAIEEMAAAMPHVVLVLPAARVNWLTRFDALRDVREAVVPVLSRADAGAAVLSAVRQAVSDAQIETFHLLFPGMGEAAAGRLLSGMAAIAKRHFGVRLLAARPLAPRPAPDVGEGLRSRPLENVF